MSNELTKYMARLAVQLDQMDVLTGKMMAEIHHLRVKIQHEQALLYRLLENESMEGMK